MTHWPDRRIVENALADLNALVGILQHGPKPADLGRFLQAVERARIPSTIDGWPAGGDGGSRSPGISDPVLAAVEARQSRTEPDPVRDSMLEAAAMLAELVGLARGISKRVVAVEDIATGARGRQSTVDACKSQRHGCIDPAAPSRGGWCTACSRWIYRWREANPNELAPLMVPEAVIMERYQRRQRIPA